MKKFLILAISLLVTTSVSAQTEAKPELPKDPKAILAMAAPYYDFEDSSIKPWHMRMTYQLFDEAGKITEEGTFEHWWIAPKISRNTWSSGNKERTEWNTSDNKHFQFDKGDQFNLNVLRINSAIFHPMPSLSIFESSRISPTYYTKSTSTSDVPCIEFARPSSGPPDYSKSPAGTYPTFCFDHAIPALIASYSINTPAVLYGSIAKFQNHFIAKDIEIKMNGKTRLKATLSELNLIETNTSIMKPAPDAKETPRRITIDGVLIAGIIERKVPPTYPAFAKASHLQGTVVLNVIIAKDGSLGSVEVASSPAAALSNAAIEAVKQWKFKPYLLYGEPVEVNTTVNFVFSLGG